MTTIKEIDLHLTNACMLSCRHCCFDAGRPLAGELPLNRWLQVLADAKELGATKIDLTGGEPLLSPHVDPLVSRATELGFDVTLQTNGILFDSDRRARLRQAGLRDVMVSMDGWHQSHDWLRRKEVFTSVRSHVEHAIVEGWSVRVNATAMRSTVGSISELIRWADSIGVSMLSIFYFTSQGRGSAMREEELSYGEWLTSVANFQELTQHVSCTRVIVEPAFGPMTFSLETSVCPMLSRGYVQILSDGRAYPCTMLIFSNLYIANVSRESLVVIREDNRWRWLIEQYNVALSSEEPYNGGCIGYSTWETGKLGPDPRWAQLRGSKRFPICPLIKLDLNTKVTALRSSLLRG